MDIVSIASWCGAIVTIVSFFFGIYKFFRAFEEKFDKIHDSIEQINTKQKEEIQNVNNTILTLNNEIIEAFNSNMFETEKSLKSLNEKIDDNKLLTLKLAIVSPNIENDEKLKLGKVYTELGGNGSVGMYLKDLEKEEYERKFKQGHDHFEHHYEQNEHENASKYYEYYKGDHQIN